MRNQNVLPMRDLEIFGIVKDGKFTIPEKEIHALKNGKMTDIVELRDLKGKEIQIEKMPARLSIIRGEDGNPKLRVDPVFKERSFQNLTDDFVFPDIQISEAQRNSYSLTHDQLKLIPDFLKGNQLSEYQKKSLAINKRVDITFPQASDELKERFYLKEDGKILNAYFTGEEEILKNKDVSFSNALNQNQENQTFEKERPSRKISPKEDNDNYLDR